MNENIGCPVFLKLDRRKSHRLTKKFQVLIIANPPNAGIWDFLPGSLRVYKVPAKIRKLDMATRTTGEGVYNKLLLNGERPLSVTDPVTFAMTVRW